MTNIALIADIHLGKDRGTKKGTAARPLIEKFIDFVNERNPDLIIELGDRINQDTEEVDISTMKEVAELFSHVKPPVAHIMGNHDVDHLTQAQNESIMGCSFDSHVQNLNGFSFIYWNADVHLDQKDGFDLPESDFLWLEKALKEKASYPAIICTHVPLDNGSMRGNYYFNENRGWWQGNYKPEQGKRLRDIIERSGKVVLCLNGHAHWNAYNCIDGIHYVTIPSLTEAFVTYPNPHEAWAWMTLDQNTIDIEVFGKTPMRYQLPMRQQDHHWANLHKDYSPLKELPEYK